jgi:DNA helicase-2/ATP-dependent DNA helicase PcrA
MPESLLEGLNEAQHEAVSHGTGPLLIVAGAGTGKTTVITNKICRLIEEKFAKPEEILALTFTEKAAAEMQDRVDEITNIGYADLHISTFHAFCQKILERHAIDIGLSNSFKLLTDTAGWVLLHKNLEKFNLDYYRPLGNPTKHIHEFLKHFSNSSISSK